MTKEDFVKNVESQNLAAALVTLDNLGGLLEMVLAKQSKKACAFSLVKAASGNLSIYVTASDSFDEEAIAKKVAGFFSEFMEYAISLRKEDEKTKTEADLKKALALLKRAFPLIDAYDEFDGPVLAKEISEFVLAQELA